jgi:hypothetical protein
MSVCVCCVFRADHQSKEPYQLSIIFTVSELNSELRNLNPLYIVQILPPVQYSRDTEKALANRADYVSANHCLEISRN